MNTRAERWGIIKLKGISLSIKRKERFVILGSNGSGATSLIDHILGLQKQISGDFVLDGISKEEIQ